MRRVQRHPGARLLVAVVLAGVITAGAWWAGQTVAFALLFAALAAVLFALLTLAPDAIAYRRGHHWRWSWSRRLGNGGPDTWLGTRVPRRPRPPTMPPRAAAARPARGGHAE